MENTKLYTVKEYAEHLGCTPQYIYKLIESGKLKKVSKGGLTYVEHNDSEPTSIKVSTQENNQFNQQIDNKFVVFLTNEVERLNRVVETLQSQLLECKNENINRIVELQDRKDAQIKQYIEFLNNSTQQLIAQAINRPEAQHQTEQAHEAEIIEVEPEPIKLTSYLKAHNYSKDEIRKIQANANKAFVKNSKRFFIRDEKMYIFPTLYNYDDIM